MANVEKITSVNGNVYTFKKTEGTKTATITITDTNGNGLDKNDKFSITGDKSIFTASEISDFTTGHKYSTSDSRTEAGVADVKIDDKNEVQAENGKEYRLGSLVDKINPQASVTNSAAPNTYNMMNPATTAGAPCMILASAYKPILDGAYNTGNVGLYTATGWSFIAQMASMITSSQKSSLPTATAPISSTQVSFGENKESTDSSTAIPVSSSAKTDSSADAPVSSSAKTDSSPADPVSSSSKSDCSVLNSFRRLTPEQELILSLQTSDRIEADRLRVEQQKQNESKIKEKMKELTKAREELKKHREALVADMVISEAAGRMSGYKQLELINKINKLEAEIRKLGGNPTEVKKRGLGGR